MAIRASVSTRHLMRLGVFTFFCIGLCVWSLYDGIVAYPAEQERYEAFMELKEDDTTNFAPAWEALALEKGWSSRTPKERSHADINVQYIQAALAGTVGVVFGVLLMRWWGCWIEANDSQITTSWGRTLEFSQIKSIDKKKWADKGICRLKYDEGGTEKTFVLDDYNFDRAPTDEIMLLVEKTVGIDKIVNGKPEKPPGEKPEPLQEEAPAEADSPTANDN